MQPNSFTQDQSFQATPAMRVWLDSAVELLTDNVSEIADKCKVSRQSWYQWSKDVEFLRWFHKEWKARLASFGWKLDVIGLQRAKESYSYWRSMQERIGNLPNKEPAIDPVWRVEIKDYTSKGHSEEKS